MMADFRDEDMTSALASETRDRLANLGIDPSMRDRAEKFGHSPRSRSTPPDTKAMMAGV